MLVTILTSTSLISHILLITSPHYIQCLTGHCCCQTDTSLGYQEWLFTRCTDHYQYTACAIDIIRYQRYKVGCSSLSVFNCRPRHYSAQNPGPHPQHPPLVLLPRLVASCCCSAPLLRLVVRMLMRLRWGIAGVRGGVGVRL